MADESQAKLVFTGPLDADGKVKEGAKAFLIELGLLVLAWNALQESLGELYGAIVADHKIEKWRRKRNDSLQRGLLLAAVDQMKTTNREDEPEAVARIKADVDWIVDQVDAIAEDRNNFVHAPFFFSVAADGALSAQAIDLFGNPRGQNLAGVDLIATARRHRDNMAILDTYAIALRSDFNGNGPPSVRPQLKQ